MKPTLQIPLSREEMADRATPCPEAWGEEQGLPSGQGAQDRLCRLRCLESEQLWDCLWRAEVDSQG